MSNTKLKKTSAYVWFDAEFTSLNLDKARLLQVAVIVTDTSLNRIAPPAEDLDLCIRLNPSEQVSPWVEENLSTLVEKCRSNVGVTIDQVDRRISAIIDRYCETPSEEVDNRPVLAGNSVHNDWYLIRRFLPTLNSRLHYRLLDVSSIKIQWQDWIGGQPFDKESIELLNHYYPGEEHLDANAHDALFDVKASIAELAFYRSKLHAVSL